MVAVCIIMFSVRNHHNNNLYHPQDLATSYQSLIKTSFHFLSLAIIRPQLHSPFEGHRKKKRTANLPFLFSSSCVIIGTSVQRISLRNHRGTKKGCSCRCILFPYLFIFFWLSHHVNSAIKPGASRSAHNEDSIENIPSIRNHLPSLEGDFIIPYIGTGRLVMGNQNFNDKQKGYYSAISCIEHTDTYRYHQGYTG